MDHLSFRLPDEVVTDLVARLPDPWEGNLLGHIVFLRTYSRKRWYLPDGQRVPDSLVPSRLADIPDDWTSDKESWADVVRRCVEGCYSIQREWAMDQRIPWSDAKALRSATEMYERMYTFKFTPPGRGLWMMGTEFVHKRLGSAALQNCAFVSTGDNFIRAAEFLMEASMLGVGVGFDTNAAGEWVVNQGDVTGQVYTIPDTREGWVESVRDLLSHYLCGTPLGLFDYEDIRPEGEPIRGFGGTAAGPEPLERLHSSLDDLFYGRNGEVLTERDVTDVMNMIGACVMAGNVRRSAEIAIGQPSEEFINLKNYDDATGEAYHPAAKGRAGHGYASNNSVRVSVGQDAPYDEIADLMLERGEPGLFWLDVSRQYGRLSDPPTNADYRATGTNPCGEQTLESYEMCNLVETYPSNHATLDDYLRTEKFAYLYAKSVTLLATHWPETNSIMLRNRRIGLSMSGIFQFVEERGLPTMRRWWRAGYDEIQRWDRVYSEWLCVRESIKTTSIKPSGSVSKIVKSWFKGEQYPGITPGIHAPVERQWKQRITVSKGDPLLPVLDASGYHMEPRRVQGKEDPSGAMIVEVPMQGPPVRTQNEVTMWEQAALTAACQADWADNSVSVSLRVHREKEGPQLGNLLHTYEGQFKSLSVMPYDEEGETYDQPPMEPITPMEYEAAVRASARGGEPDFSSIYGGAGEVATGVKFCDTDACEI